MKKIYLASNSKARKKLLKSLGFKFKVFPSHAKEIRKLGGLSYAKLVEKNALAKAEYVAGRIAEGIIIAADTITVQDGKIFGKPNNLKQARLMLKRLSQKPQSVYSGLAVIDKQNNKTFVASERTRVYMDKLSDKDISRYFYSTSPLDKAGSFDIQGRGAFFINKLDGCFYNVVGLPIRKLYLILKKLDPKLFLFLFLVFLLSGCSSEYNLVTKKQELYYYSTDKEVQMGRSIDLQIAKEYKGAKDPLVQKRVEDIGKKIAAVSDRKDIDYHFKVIEDDEVNAVSLPGGYVYVFRGLIDRVDSDDELACVLAHEVGHVVARHSIKKLQAEQAYTVLRLLVAVAPGSGQVGNAADVAFTELLLGYSREDELLADKLGTRYAKLAGYNPQGMISFLKKLQNIDRRMPLQPFSYFKTHPYVPDRIRVVKQELGQQIKFDDYINIEQKEHE